MQVGKIGLVRHGRARAAGLAVALMACTGCMAPLLPGAKTQTVAPEQTEISADYVMSGAYKADWRRALRDGSGLGALAQRADQVAIARSPTVFELRAASADSAAEQAAWLPSVRPVATAGFGGVASGVGISISQMIYDFSQTATRRKRADIARVMTELDFWDERNETVLQAAEAYLAAVAATDIIAARDALEARLATIAAREDDRLKAGVAGQGDALFVDVSRQENRRETIRQRALLAQAQAEVAQATEQPFSRAVPGLKRVVDSCHILPDAPYAPALMRARMAIELARMEQQSTEKALLPRIMGQAQAVENGRGQTTQTAQIALEGGTIAGGDARLRIEAAKQRTQAAAKAFGQLAQDLERDVTRLRMDSQAQAASLGDYAALIATNERSLALFEDRFATGAAQSSEAVRLEVERTANIIAISEARALIGRNCLSAARLYGALSPVEFKTE
jgi:outer membrane protein TolC